MKLSNLFLSALMMVATSSSAFASVDFAQLKDLREAAIAKFLKEANNASSIVGKKIAQNNLETTDGRNQQGSISLPVKRGDIQVVLLGSEVITQPAHYAVLKNRVCTTTGASTAQFLVLLGSELGEHKSYSDSMMSFTIDTNQDVSFTISGGKADQLNCELSQMEAGDAGTAGKEHLTNSADEPKPFEIPAQTN